MSLQVTDFIVAGPAGQVTAGPAGHVTAGPPGQVAPSPAGHVPIDTTPARVPIDTFAPRIPYAAPAGMIGRQAEITGGSPGASMGTSSTISMQGGGGGSAGTTGSMSVGGSTVGGGGGGGGVGGGGPAQISAAGSNVGNSAGGGSVGMSGGGGGSNVIINAGGGGGAAAASGSPVIMGGGGSNANVGQAVSAPNVGNVMIAPNMGISPVSPSGFVLPTPKVGFSLPILTGFTTPGPASSVMPHKLTSWHGPSTGHITKSPGETFNHVHETQGWEEGKYTPFWIPTPDGYEEPLPINEMGNPFLQPKGGESGAHYDMSDTFTLQYDGSVTFESKTAYSHENNFRSEQDYSTNNNPNYVTNENKTLQTDNSVTRNTDMRENNTVNIEMNSEHLMQNDVQTVQNVTRNNVVNSDHEININERRMVNNENVHREVKQVDNSSVRTVERKVVTENVDNSVTNINDARSMEIRTDNSVNVVHKHETVNPTEINLNEIRPDNSRTTFVDSRNTYIVDDSAPVYNFDQSTDFTVVNNFAAHERGTGAIASVAA